MRPRYIGPLVIIGRNKGGAYIICELNGSVFDRPVAAFRVVPYFARKSIPLPKLNDFLDIPTDWLQRYEKDQRKQRPIWTWEHMVIDYIAGMTDAFAEKIYNELFGLKVGSIYDLD